MLGRRDGGFDEQTNAYFSILRTRGVPGWYALVSSATRSTQTKVGRRTHGVIQLPLKDSWCEERNIVLQTCFVDAQVDVVNNKWLLSTPTAYLDWIEEADPSGGMVYDYYHPVRSITVGQGESIERLRSFETKDTVELNGGTYKVKNTPRRCEGGNDMRVIIGGAGRVGIALAKALANERYDLVVVDNDSRAVATRNRWIAWSSTGTSRIGRR